MLRPLYWLLSLHLVLSDRGCHAFIAPSSTRVITSSFQNKKVAPLHALMPLPVSELSLLLSTGAPTSSQYSTYWGRTSKEKYARWNEAALVTLLGTLLSYCLSFVFGSFIATLLGVVCCVWAILGPEVQATQRNWELLGGRSLVDPWIVEAEQQQDYQDLQGLYGALFLGRVADLSVVEDALSQVEYDVNDFEDYTMEDDELEQITGSPYLLRVRLEDAEGRTLQVHARMSEEYLSLQENQPVAGVLLSTSQTFTSLAALTDFVVPDAECWIGDYPYLDRYEMEGLLASNDGLYWDALQLESSRTYYNNEAPGFNSDAGGEYWSPEPEPARRRKSR